ncbi:hypothetical protein V8C37DRAFT_413978 [Trichoderma ceciliae]
MLERPSCREDFEVAIICALPLEYDAVVLLFDEFWDKDGDPYRRAAGDPNTYTTGRIGRHDVVLAFLPHMGKANAAAAAASMRSSYTALKIVFLTGICGGVPYNGQDEVLLGDVVISKSIVQYDFGRKYPHEFKRKDNVQDNLGKHDKNILSLLAILNTGSGRQELQEKTAYVLEQLQSKAAKYNYPGIAKDKLFGPGYRHKHHTLVTGIYDECHITGGAPCAEAMDSSCDDLGCDETFLVARKRSKKQHEQGKTRSPAIYIGAIASGDTVMKSGQDRDTIAKKEDVIAFEMEGAGVWEEMPCIVVKGVCDYADCHKNKLWQNFAAAAAASALKAILERYIQTDRGHGRFVGEAPSGHLLIPFGRNESFVGREMILSEILKRIPPVANKDDCQGTVIEGLGGVGKTQIALEAVYLVHNEHPECSIFWVPAINAVSFENAYRDIGKQLGIEGINRDEADIKQLVKAALSEESSALLFGATRLFDHLPSSQRGSILFTTRNHEIAVKLDVPARSIIRTSNTEATKRLLDFLANLPLAIKQASAFMATKDISTSKYLRLCELEHRDMIDLLSRDFEDRYRYKEIQNPVATTWLISFGHILQHDRLAAEYLQSMSVLAEKDIPKSLLPEAEELKSIDAIGTLKAYVFIIQHEGKDLFGMHRLNQGQPKECVTSAIQRLNRKFPFPQHDNRDAVLEFREHSGGNKAEADLLHNVACGNFMLGQYQTAELEYRRAVQIRERAQGRDHPETLISMNNLAAVLNKLGRHEEAEEMHWQILELREKELGKEHPDTLVSMNNFANTLVKRGRYKEAEEMYQQTLDLREKVLGREHPDTLVSMNNLASVLFNLSKHKEAEEMHRQILELREKVHGKEHPDTLVSMNNLASVLYNLSKYKEAEEMHHQTLELREKVLGKEHPDTLISMNDLAGTLRKLGRYDKAEDMYQQVLELKEKVLGREHPNTQMSRENLSNCWRARKRGAGKRKRS